MKIILCVQLIWFALYGLVVGEAFAYRIQREREFNAELIAAMPVDSLSKISVEGS